MTDDSPHPLRAPGSATLAAVALTIAIVFAATRVFPTSTGRVGLMYFLGTMCALLAYAGIAYAARRAEDAETISALRAGGRVGAVMAVIAIALLVYNAVGPRTLPAIRIFVTGNWMVLVLGLSFAGGWGAARTGSVKLGLLSSIWAAVVSTAFEVLVTFTLGLAWMSEMKKRLFAEFDASGMTDSSAFIVRSMMAQTVPQLVRPLVGALLLGAIGALLATVITRTRSR